ncbi:MAG: UDP-N-acetylmuramoyl-L-alanine--D-glutamate ligase [Solirubrobacteraceae bacterium]
MNSRPDLPPGPYLVVGLARSGIAAALALRARGERVVGVDGGAPAGLDTLDDAGVELHLDNDGVSLLEGVSTVVKSPGVPATAPVIAGARSRGMCVMGELELAWRMLSNEFIAVTGTNGKTTTVELIGHIHREAGLPVAVAGNVGVALSGLVQRVQERVVVVCEASSFQLEDTLAFAPEAAVLLNLAPDHLDRHGTVDAYMAAKLRIFARQSGAAVAVVPAGFQDGGLPGAARRVEFGSVPDAQLSEREGVLHWEGQPLLNITELSLRGAHNLQNAMAAAAVCLVRGLDPDSVRAGLRDFAGVPHRLEELARIDGVLFVNDSKATNVASTLVALDAFALGSVHLILGGQGKGQDFWALREPARHSCRAVYLIGEDAPAIAAVLQDSGLPVHDCGDLDRAVAAAREAAGVGETILLSPGCASFDQFGDFEARGERFRELVRRS